MPTIAYANHSRAAYYPLQNLLLLLLCNTVPFDRQVVIEWWIAQDYSGSSKLVVVLLLVYPTCLQSIPIARY